MVKVFGYKIEERVRNMELGVFYPYIDDVKLDKIKKKQKNQLESLLADLLVKYILKHYYGIDDVLFQYNEFQKPYIVNQGLFFNISHSYDYIMCAMSSYEVGIDVEKIRPINDKRLAKTFFTDYEYDLIQSSENLDLFFSIWTMKESYLKYIGKGLNESLKSFEIDLNQMVIKNKEQVTYIKTYSFDPTYKCSVCSRKNKFEDEITWIKTDNFIK